MRLLKSNLIFLKTLLFFLFDSLALWNVSPKKKNKFEIVLLVRQDAIGDFVLWLDTAKEYRQLYPPQKYKIILICNALWYDLAKELLFWDEVLPVNINKFKTLSIYRWNLLKQVQNLAANIALQPTYSREFYHGDSLVRASNASQKVSSVGDMSNRNWLKKTLADSWHTELIPVSLKPMTELKRNAEFLSGILQKQYILKYPKIEVLEAWEIIKCKKKEFYVLSLGASENCRAWPVSFYGEIAQRIYENTGWHGFVCGVNKEFDLGEQIKNICHAPLENYAGRTSLKELAWLLAKSKILICNESGAAHIATAVGTSTVSIVGGGHFGRFVPYPKIPGSINKFEAVFQKMPCYGCNWECIYPIKKNEPAPCITTISVDAVWEKVKPLLPC